MSTTDNPQALRQRKLAIKPIASNDLPAILDMLVEFAAYEQVREPVQATVADLEREMADPRKRLFGFIARKDGDTAGMILGYETYSTYAGRARLNISDLFVRARCRGSGIGRALVAMFARHAVATGCVAVKWEVLKANGPAVRLYRGLGATISDEHSNCSLTGEALQVLASGAVPVPERFRFAANDGRFSGRLS